MTFGQPWPQLNVYEQGAGTHAKLTVQIRRQPFRSVVLIDFNVKALAL